MTADVLIDQFSAEQWHGWAGRFADYSIYQTWSFGEQSAPETGSKVSRIVVRRDGGVVGMAQLRIKRIPLIGSGLAYLYRGPLWKREAATDNDFGDVVRAIGEEYSARRGLVTRVVPNLLSSDAPATAECTKSGFASDPSSTPEMTFVLDLSPPLETLRKNLEQKWRNGLNQAMRKGLTIRIATDDASLAEFERLYLAMWEHKRFETGVSVQSFRHLQARLPADAKLQVLLAHQGEDLVAGHVSSTLGDTCIYLLGASNEMGRQAKASYLLQWQTVELARAAGDRFYDLGGVDLEKNPGVYHFKAGLGGQEVRHCGQFTACPKGSRQLLLPVAERAYRLMHRVKRSLTNSTAAAG